MSLSGKRVLVTGAGGFIGSHLTERLVREGAQVTALLRYSSSRSHGWLQGSPVEADIRFVYGDITDGDFVRAALRGQDIVFHLAALIGIPYSYIAPNQYVRVNVEGTSNVMQAAREFGLERVLQTSTSEVYGTAMRVPMDEGHPKQPQSPYSASKIAADNIAESFYHSFNTPVVIVRPFNTFGPRQSMRAVIPTIIMQCLTKRTVMLGSTTPTRDMNYIDDTVEGFLNAAEAPAAQVVGQQINLGSGVEHSIGQIVQMIAEKIGVQVGVEESPERQRPVSSEVFRLVADRTKAEKLIGWKPRVDFSDGLNRTISWFEANRDYYPVTDYVV